MNLFLLLVALVPLLTEARPRQSTCVIDGVAVYFGRTHRRSYCEFCHCTADGSFKCHPVAGLSSINCPVLTCPEHVAFIPMTAGEHQCCKVCPENYQQEYPSFSGYRNNLAFPKMGAVGDMLTRDSPPSYQDGVSAPRTHSAADSTVQLPNARAVSIAVSDQAGAALPDPQGLTSWAWQWGQFNDHDTTLVTELTPGAENIDIEVVAGDPDSFSEPIHQQRGNWDQNTGSGPANPRSHANSISVYVDCSNVYGPDAFVAAKLRSFSDGKLKVGSNDPFGIPLPPDNDAASGIDIVMAHPDATAHTFALGDIRANEQNNLLATHSLFVWAHNKMADELRTHLIANDVNDVSATIMQKYQMLSSNPAQRAIQLDDLLYFEARKINCARMQKITFDEWIPAITGSTLPKYSGYKPEVNPQFSTEFSAALFRVGHTMIQNDYKLTDYQDVSEDVTLTDIFFDTTQFATYGTRPFIHAISSTLSQEVDVKAADSVRKSLFRMNVDLVALNINRGREQGLSGFNDVSEILTGHRYGENGLDPFEELTGETGPSTPLADTLRTAYNGRFDDIDLWIGAMAEKHSVGIFGAVVGTSIRNTFTKLRDGDRFYYDNYLAADEKTLYLEGFKLGTLIRQLYDDTAGCTNCINVGNADTVFGADYEDFFFCNGNGAIPAADCPSTCSTELRQCNGNVMSQVHENARDGCNNFPCTCQGCQGVAVEEVCGSDGITYDNECRLQLQACRSHTDITVVHRRPCFDTSDLLEFEVDVRKLTSGNCNECHFELVQNAFGGPVHVEIDISRGGRGNKGVESAAVDIVDSCDSQKPINPLSTPEQPLPPLSNTIQLDDGEGEGVLVGTSFINYGSSLLFSGERREADPQLSLLYHSMLVTVGNDQYCGIITGAPVAVLETFTSPNTGGFGAINFGDSLSVLVTQPLSGASESIVKVSMDDRIREEIREIGGVFEVRALTNCPNRRDDTPDQFNYAAASRPVLINGQVPPLLTFSMDRNLRDYEFTQGNPLLSVVGLESPLRQKVAVFSVRNNEYIARGNQNPAPWCAEFRLAQEEHGCLLDIGRGLGAFLDDSNPFFLNEGNQTSNTGISASGTVTSSSSSFLTSPTGVMILVALVVVLLAALVFLSIVLYVRSNPYTAPAPLKKVASLSGAQKGTPITPST